MSNLKRESEKINPGQATEPTSSHGTHSRSVTPKDTSPEDAAHRDVHDRQVASSDLEEKAQAILDDAIEQTFPASDPIAIPSFEEALEMARLQQAKENANQGTRR